MAIPEFKSFILPVLKFAGDGGDHSLNEVRAHLTQVFQMNEQDLAEPLPSGVQTRFSNRVQWARTYLVKAGLLDPTGRGRFRITERGKQVLHDPPDVIDKAYLSRFSEFAQFSAITPSASDQETPEGDGHGLTPQELLDSIYQDLRQALVDELLTQLKKASPKFFEQVVVDVLVKMGYGGSRADAGRAVGQSGDEGIDGIIKEDRLGLDVVLLQAKRWDNPVGRPHVQNFVGSLAGQRATKGVFITTSQFTQDATDYVKSISPKVVLIDGRTLAQFMIDFEVGVAEQVVYKIRRIDTDYFEDEP